MNITILHKSMNQEPDESYKGQVIFEVEGHSQPYEVILLTKKGKVWDYSLSFAKESGTEEEIFAVEKAIEEDDELFDQFIDAVDDALESQEKQEESQESKE
ncbi:hypothetical protein Back11_35210 [Paenibacillus baekrokdamisoli]|uniref:Uncharacterized protein n=1 Tax=Paenibacillus baekrokdamisoli TaxID=1712516 RepID=A0A3G9IUS0_9BACL|nr:hypothetical protein [Paenibacillus baekrokdamisoli]MBB3070886.1 hypothetical protein [Paenibacillus baekrokdamisoli]BBH22176.1 hypothetical protein Back11_35210 [Paenibacillus baekrokdamisoli]